MTRKSYGQYCGLAKALDHVGDRWTLLIVRELLLGPRRYAQIRHALPGIATNLLADRLRDLERDEIIQPSPAGGYELTAFGWGLEEVVHAMVRWGGRWMTHRDSRESFRPEWLAVALAALLPQENTGTVQIRSGGVVVTIHEAGVSVGETGSPDAVVEGEPEAVLGVASGQAPLSWLKVTGDRRIAAAVLGLTPDG